MAREHNVIQQQDRPQKPATCQIPALQIHTTCQKPAQKKPATCPTITLQPAQQQTSNLSNRNQQPANRTINLNHNL